MQNNSLIKFLVIGVFTLAFFVTPGMQAVAQDDQENPNNEYLVGMELQSQNQVLRVGCKYAALVGFCSFFKQRPINLPHPALQAEVRRAVD